MVLVQSTFKVDDKATREPPYADKNKHPGRRLTHESERELIGAEVRRLTHRLFGRHVADRAENRACLHCRGELRFNLSPPITCRERSPES